MSLRDDDYNYHDEIEGWVYCRRFISPGDAADLVKELRSILAVDPSASIDSYSDYGGGRDLAIDWRRKLTSTERKQLKEEADERAASAERNRLEQVAKEQFIQEAIRAKQEGKW